MSSDDTVKTGAGLDLPGEQEHKDWLLRFLVYLANRANAEIPITLQVSGIILTGIIVSEKEYFDHFGRIFERLALKKENISNDEMESLNQLGVTLMEWFQSFGQQELRPPDLAGELKEIHYIHLKSARIIHNVGSSIPQRQNVWWRGRLDEISGFFMGALMFREENDLTIERQE